MVLFVILGYVPTVLLVCLAGLLWLTWIELRDRPMEPLVKLWWGLLVLLTHVPGYLGMRAWLAIRGPAAERRPA
jgi:hypothetical protein